MIKPYAIELTGNRNRYSAHILLEESSAQAMMDDGIDIEPLAGVYPASDELVANVAMKAAILEAKG